MTYTRRGLFAAAAAISITRPVRAAEDSPVSGGTLIAVIQPEPTVLSSAFLANYYVGVVANNMFDGLLRYDMQFKPLPGLAESWELAPDGLSITFRLRKNVTWHDGKPFTAEDVRFSFMEILKKYSARARTNFEPLTGIETPDPQTAVFHLSDPAPAMISCFDGHDAQVLPAHLYQGTDILRNPYNSKPVGTGPFRFKEWARGEYIRMDRNPDYWDKGRPYLDQIIFRFIPDAGSRADALETGAVQYGPYDTIPLADYKRIKSVSGLSVSAKGYDYQSQMLLLEMNVRRKYTSHLEVRQAIAHAISLERLTQTVWYGVGKAATSPVPSTSGFYDIGSAPQYAYDVAKANDLLDQAGFARGADGIRFSLALAYMPFNDTLKRSAEFVHQSLKAVGIDAQIYNTDLASYTQKVYTNYDFDLNLGTFAAFFDPDMGLIRFYWSKLLKAGIPWVNASGYSNPKMDEIIVQQKRELDPVRRKELIHQMQELAMTDLPVLPLVEMQHFTVYSDKLHGLNQAPDGALIALTAAWLKK